MLFGKAFVFCSSAERWTSSRKQK